MIRPTDQQSCCVWSRWSMFSVHIYYNQIFLNEMKMKWKIISGTFIHYRWSSLSVDLGHLDLSVCLSQTHGIGLTWILQRCSSLVASGRDKVPRTMDLIICRIWHPGKFNLYRCQWPTVYLLSEICNFHLTTLMCKMVMWQILILANTPTVGTNNLSPNLVKPKL